MEKHHEPDIQKDLKKHFDDAVDTFKEIKDPGKMNIGKEVQNAFEVLKLNTKKMHDIGERKTSATPALIFIVLAAVATNLGLYLSLAQIEFLRPSIGSLVIAGVMYIVLFFVMTFILDFVGSIVFKGKGKFSQLFRVMGYGSVVMIAGLIPFLGGIASIWLLIVTYKAIETVKKLNPVNIILTILIAAVVLALLNYLLLMIFGFGPMHTIGIDSSWFN